MSCWHAMEMFGGISFELGDIIDVVGLGRWLLMLAVYFFIIGLKLSMENSIRIFAVYRYSGFYEWWTRHFTRVQKICFIVFILNCAVFGIWDICFGQLESSWIADVLYFYLHIAMYCAVITVGDLVCEKNLLPCVLLVLEAVLYVISVKLAPSYIAFGMYNRCSFDKFGIITLIICVIKLIVIAVCFYSGRWLWKNGIIEERQVF